MNVVVVFRGNLGDMCLWMTKLKGLLKKHIGDEIYFVFNTHYEVKQVMELWGKVAELNEYYIVNWERFIKISYQRPFIKNSIINIVPKWDYFYNFDVLKEGENNFGIPIFQRYPELGVDLHPVKLADFKEDLVIIAPEGRFIKGVWDKKHWQALIDYFVDKSYEVYLTGDDYSYKNIANKKPFASLFELIKYISVSKLCISLDTGIRNVAFIYKVPVIELGTPGKSMPCYDVFHPKEYRGLSYYFPDIDKIKPDDVIREANLFLGIGNH